jgi:hypothetical protein
MKRMLRVLVVVTVAALWLVTSGVAAAQDQGAATAKTPHHAKAAAGATHAAKAKVELPAAIKSAFEAAYPTGTIKNVSKETEDGELRYEVESIDGSMARDLIYRVDGTVVEIEEALATADLPPPVRDAISARYPEGKVLKAERLTRGATVVYEMRIRLHKRTREVVLDPSGALVRNKKEASERESEK